MHRKNNLGRKMPPPPSPGQRAMCLNTSKDNDKSGTANIHVTTYVPRRLNILMAAGASALNFALILSGILLRLTPERAPRTVL